MGLTDGSRQEGNFEWDIWPRFHVSTTSYLVHFIVFTHRILPTDRLRILVSAL